MNRSPVTNKPYINDAVIGNSSMLVALDARGEIHRLWWPHVDMPQHVETMKMGVLVEGMQASTSWLDQAEAWRHEQSYLPRTNILRTQATGKKVPVVVATTDFAVPDEDLLVRNVELTNTGEAKLTLTFFVYASLQIAENALYNSVSFDRVIDGLLYFRHQYAFALSGANVCAGYAIGDAFRHATAGYLPGDTIGMVPHGALAFRLSLAPGETRALPLYLTAGTTVHEASAKMHQAKRVGAAEWLARTEAYWQKYLRGAKPLAIRDKQVQAVYERSLLVFKLMSDQATGSVIAAPEFDEAFTRCGGYAYCWGRDAAYITTAFDQAGLTSLTRAFYRWAVLAQDPDGSWQQRHYHDGRLAPSWGLQIDEGGSILWGMHQHYLMTGDRSFLEEMWPAVEKGASFLLSYLDAETGLPLPSRDLWEEREAEHTYSAAAVYGGLSGAAAIARELGQTALATAWREAAGGIKRAMEQHAVDGETNTFLRGIKLRVSEEEYREAVASGKSTAMETDEKGYTRYLLMQDNVLDISLIGLAVPFRAFDVHDPRMVATADAIERACTSPVVGGIRRYEDDAYIGGNPWILTTLWLAQYRIQQGRIDEAKQHFAWAVKHATSLNLLPEQIDKETGETAWVVPLTWSHAMFVLTAHMLAEAGVDAL
ncbi:glycoside hydrolase family 15 protein [Laceyella putida]|uniref:Glycoside hydrolase family 15 protein n=1 Tax=Laceyella putida TaxID=110101 RepID=A0ABW2RFQ2_9BACL